MECHGIWFWNCVGTLSKRKTVFLLEASWCGQRKLQCSVIQVPGSSADILCLRTKSRERDFFGRIGLWITIISMKSARSESLNWVSSVQKFTKKCRIGQHLYVFQLRSFILCVRSFILYLYVHSSECEYSFVQYIFDVTVKESLNTSYATKCSLL